MLNKKHRADLRQEWKDHRGGHPITSCTSKGLCNIFTVTSLHAMFSYGDVWGVGMGKGGGSSQGNCKSKGVSIG